MLLIKELIKFLIYALLLSIYACVGWSRSHLEDDMTDEDFYFCIVLGVAGTACMYLASWEFS